MSTSLRLLTHSTVCVLTLALACSGSDDNRAQPKVATSGNGGSGTGGSSDLGGAPDGTSGTSGTGMVTAPAKGVLLTPKNGRVSLGGNLHFTAVVTDLSDTSVSWKIREGSEGGDIDADGLYSAPSTSGTFHVVATSNADSTYKDEAAVTVAAPAGTMPVLKTGVWADITPPADMKCCLGSGGNTYGVIMVTVDPGNPRTIYAGIVMLGLWKSTDGGSNWERLGNPGEDENKYDGSTNYLDTPFRVAVDPTNSDHLIATDGVDGGSPGFWVSWDGGHNWQRPPAYEEIAKLTSYDMTTLSIDPTDFNHILISSHGWWTGIMNAGILETLDGGESWIVHPPASNWPSGTNNVEFLYDPATKQGNSKTWLLCADAFYRTTDSGEHWTKVADIAEAHGGTGTLHYTKEGVIYSGSGTSPVRSRDNGLTWEKVGDLPNGQYYAINGDGETLYTMISATFGSTPWGSFWTSPESDGDNWALQGDGVQTFPDGPIMLTYDKANKIMYAASWEAGLLALKVR